MLRFADFCAVIYTFMALIGLGVTAAWLSSWSGSVAVDHSQGILYETRSPRELMFESKVYEPGVPCRLQNLSFLMPFIAHPSVALDFTAKLTKGGDLQSYLTLKVFCPPTAGGKRLQAATDPARQQRPLCAALSTLRRPAQRLTEN